LLGRRDNDGLHKRRGIWYYALNIDGERRFFSAKTRNYQEARRVRAEAIKAQLENPAYGYGEMALRAARGPGSPRPQAALLRTPDPTRKRTLRPAAKALLRPPRLGDRQRRHPGVPDGQSEDSQRSHRQPGVQAPARDSQSRQGLGNPRGRLQAIERRP